MQPVPRLEVAFNEYSPPALESPGLIKRTLRLRLGQLHFIAEPCSKSCETVNDVSNSDILTFTDCRFGITSLHQHKWLGPGNKNKEQDFHLKSIDSPADTDADMIPRWPWSPITYQGDLGGVGALLLLLCGRWRSDLQERVDAALSKPSRGQMRSQGCERVQVMRWRVKELVLELFISDGYHYDCSSYNLPMTMTNWW